MTMAKEEFESEIEIGELLIRSADEDGDFFIKIGKNRSTSLGTEEMKDIVRFLQYHLSECELPTHEQAAEKFAIQIQTKEGTASRANAIEWFKAGAKWARENHVKTIAFLEEEISQYESALKNPQCSQEMVGAHREQITIINECLKELE